MAIRQQKKLASLGLIPGISLDLNPFSQEAGSARILRNVIPERGRTLRKPFSPQFHETADTASGSVWAIIDFKFTRSSTPETQLLIFRSDGRIYKRVSGDELEIFPGKTGFSALAQRPQPIALANLLHFADGTNGFVYDGYNFYPWGITRQTSAPTVSAVAAGSLTAATGLKAVITEVILDEAGNRVYESNRSDKSGFQVLSSQNLRIDVSGFTFNSSTTHWSGYVSELNGSEILKRSNTTRKSTTTFDVSALPAATDPKAPVRNDVPPRGVIAEAWNNRIALNQPTRPDRLWFTAFGEVKGLSNGTPDLVVPGADSSSISNLVNEIRMPDPNLRAMRFHENVLFAFTDTDGYFIQGTAQLLDDRAPRDLAKFHQFDEGSAGKYAIASTPFGLIWLTPGRKLLLWPGGRETHDIGFDIQPVLDNIAAADVDETFFYYWSGNNRKWLLMACNAPAAEDIPTTTTAWRVMVFDFDLARQGKIGGWFEWTDVTARCFSEYIEDNYRFLLAGDNSGDVYQLDVIADPAHLNSSMLLGRTYLGSTVQNNPAMTIRTGLITPEGDQPTTGQYLISLVGQQESPGNTVGTATVTDPTYTSWVDPVNPNSPGSGITLTLGSAKQSGEKWAWLRADSSADRSGALGKQFLFQATYSAGTDDSGEADGRKTAVINALYKLGSTWSRRSEIAQE